MRGSPLIRTALVLIALVLTAWGLGSLSRQRSSEARETPAAEPSDLILETPAVLTLSAPAKSVTLEVSGRSIELPADSRRLTTTLPLQTGHPAIFIDIEWRATDPSPRFAKLVLEPPGHPTLTRFFDASGPISDVWELHLHDH